MVFIGDSITQGWEGAGKEQWEQHYANRKAINLGFGGDRTEHVLWRLTQGNYGKVKPKVAVVMIGTNNTGHSMQDPLQVSAGVQKILTTIGEKTPDTKVLLLGVFPGLVLDITGPSVEALVSNYETALAEAQSPLRVAQTTH